MQPAAVRPAPKAAAVATVLAAVVLAAAGAAWATAADGLLLQVARAVVGIGFAGLGTWLSWTDLRTRRLPTRAVLGGVIGFTAVVLAQLALQHDAAPALRAVLGGAGLCLAFAAVALAVPGAIGGGDVKLAMLTGGITAWAGWPAFVVGLLAAFLLAGAVAAVLLLLRRAHRGTRIPFGPFLCAGVWVGLLVT